MAAVSLILVMGLERHCTNTRCTEGMEFGVLLAMDRTVGEFHGNGGAVEDVCPDGNVCLVVGDDLARSW